MIGTPDPWVIKAGELRRKVTLLAPTSGQNSLREAVNGWSVIAEVWAKVEPLTGRELYRAQQVQPDVTDRVTIRYRAGMTPDMKINHEGRLLNILYIKDVGERRRKLEIYCIEVIE